MKEVKVTCDVCGCQWIRDTMPGRFIALIDNIEFISSNDFCSPCSLRFVAVLKGAIELHKKIMEDVDEE